MAVRRRGPPTGYGPPRGGPPFVDPAFNEAPTQRQSSRVFIGNLTAEVTPEEVKALFEGIGEVTDLYLNASKSFCFVKLHGKDDAAKACERLDGMHFHGRELRVRIAAHNATLWVGELSPYVTNELLFSAFSQFGPLERAIVKVDDKGGSAGWGFVEFERKKDSLRALKACEDGMLLLTRQWKPVRAESMTMHDASLGFEAKNLFMNRQTEEELSVPWRFAVRGSAQEKAFAARWSQLYQDHKKRKEALKAEFEGEKSKLHAEMMQALATEQRARIEEDRRLMEDMERQEYEMRMRDRFGPPAPGGFDDRYYGEPHGPGFMRGGPPGPRGGPEGYGPGPRGGPDGYGPGPRGGEGYGPGPRGGEGYGPRGGEGYGPGSDMRGPPPDMRGPPRGPPRDYGPMSHFDGPRGAGPGGLMKRGPPGGDYYGRSEYDDFEAKRVRY